MRGVDVRHAKSCVHALGRAQLVLDLLRRGIAALGPTDLANLLQPRGLDRQAEQLVARAAAAARAAARSPGLLPSTDNWPRKFRTAGPGTGTSASCPIATRPAAPHRHARTRGLWPPSSLASAKLVASMRVMYPARSIMPCARPSACELFCPSSVSSGARNASKKSRNSPLAPLTTSRSASRTSVLKMMGGAPSASAVALIRCSASAARSSVLMNGKRDRSEGNTLELTEQAVTHGFRGDAGMIGDEEHGPCDRLVAGHALPPTAVAVDDR